MKQLIRISLGLAVLFFTSCTNTSQEDKLAIQLSQSKNFIQLELISKKMMDQVNQIKKDPELSNTFKNLDSLSRRDSILQYLLRSENFSQISRQMAEAATVLGRKLATWLQRRSCNDQPYPDSRDIKRAFRGI